MMHYNSNPAVGEKGVLHLHCRVCGSTWTTFLHERQTSAACRCGCTVKLDRLARFEYTCPCCGRHIYGHTNIEGADITVNCKCGDPITMEWNPKKRMYIE